MYTAHRTRVRAELSKAGITGYALRRAEGRYLPQIIHDNEHIKAAVYGRTQNGTAMLVATDHRIIYLDKKPLMAICDEISYEVIAGVGVSRESGFFASVTIYTRMGNYTVRFVNPTSARRLDNYLGKMRLEGSPQPDTRRTKPVPKTSAQASPRIALQVLDSKALDFLTTHELGILSTVDRTGQLHGAAVYYTYLHETGKLYLLTKSETTKAHNILATHQVALTIYDEPAMQTLQINGQADIESDPSLKQSVFERINVVRDYGGERHHAPVTKLTDGSFMVFAISISKSAFTSFKPK